MQARLFSALNCAIAAGLCALSLGCGKKGADESSTAKSPAGKASTNAAERLQWNMDTLVEYYLKRGRRDPKWDESATNLLVRFARIRSGDIELDETQRELLKGDARDAVHNGCEDPLILYLFARNAVPYEKDVTYKAIADAHRNAAEVFFKGQYPVIRQFYAYLRAAEAIRDADPTEASWPEVSKYRERAGSMLHHCLNEPHMPVLEVSEACDELFNVLKNNPGQYREYFRLIEPILLQNWPEQSFVYLTQGTFRIAEAWRVRGNTISDKVSEEGWKGFNSNIVMAAESLEKAWNLNPRNPRIATEMMSIELGQGQGRERMELWFNRAMALDTNHYVACEAKISYLEPKWYGSTQEMISFGRECVASEKWGGRVPMILAVAHDRLAGYAKYQGNTNYWKTPGVWRDIKSALDKFFILNPGETGWHHNYVWYAYHCAEWDEFNKRLPLLGPINHSYFGGQETFERMVSNARERGSKPPAN